MNIGILTITFSETIDPTSFTLFNDNRFPHTNRIQHDWWTVATSFEELKSKNIFTLESNSFLVNSRALRKMSGNKIEPLISSDFTRDATNPVPTQFNLDQYLHTPTIFL